MNTISSAVSVKALLLICATLSDKVTEESDEQAAKAASPINSTESGITILVNEEHETNALWQISLHFGGRVTLVSTSQEAKVYAGTVSSLSDSFAFLSA